MKRGETHFIKVVEERKDANEEKLKLRNLKERASASEAVKRENLKRNKYKHIL